MLIFLTDKKIDSDSFIRACVEEYWDFYSLPKRDFTIIRDSSKKPRLDLEAPKFSLSHSGKYTMLAISSKEVGLDIQRHNDCDFSIISKRFFHKDEQDLEKREFFDLWAAKEAYAKCKEIELIAALRTFIKDKNITLLNLIDNYSVAIASQDKDILIIIK
ncbi:MAG: 4'-phosphopantetheinyl transferase superfamily protein [Bacillota bacterium]|jgi:4'-phosphopantetheinyl transferase|nr:4'-phosphopantetheinyl transferase superfamily protein [Bacillota bacterium]HHU43406.1 4'-phosphopantetheinyl transferase superfamily protein [Clostridiales bacterium]